jgi:hypothetical protein
MSILNRLAHSQNRRDEELNMAPAKELAAARDNAGIREIAKNLWNDAAEIQSDCLLQHLGACRPKDVPQRAEKIAVAVDAGKRAAFVAALEKRMGDLSSAQAGRVKKVIKQDNLFRSRPFICCSALCR